MPTKELEVRVYEALNGFLGMPNTGRTRAMMIEAVRNIVREYEPVPALLAYVRRETPDMVSIATGEWEVGNVRREMDAFPERFLSS